MAGKTDFTSATMIPESQAVSPLPNQNFGPKADFPSATSTPIPKKAGREGAGAGFQDTKKGTSDFSSATNLPLPTANPNSTNRPTSQPQAFEKGKK